MFCMYFAYIDETGIDGKSPLVVMTGILVNDERLTRTQGEFSAIFSNLGDLVTGNLKELKAADLFAGKGVWRHVEGEKRRNVVGNLCEWVGTRKHEVALAAIHHDTFNANQPSVPALQDVWQASACHIALQLQKRNQKMKGSKGRTVLVFDDNKRGLAEIADLVYDPPAWTDTFYEKPKKKPQFDQLIDTPFAVKSHHVGLVQVADVYAWIFRPVLGDG